MKKAMEDWILHGLLYYNVFSIVRSGFVLLAASGRPPAWKFISHLGIEAFAVAVLSR